MSKDYHGKTYPASRELLRTRLWEDTPHGVIASKLAFTDFEFLVRDDLRPVRLQLEFMKADLLQAEQGIEATIVVFGSARIGDAHEMRIRWERAKAALSNDPDNPILLKRVDTLKSLLDKTNYYDEARKFGKMISEFFDPKKNRPAFVVVTGGGPGIMEAANRGSHDVGGKSIGLSIALPKEQLTNSFVTPELSFQFHYFAMRKMHFLKRAKALVVFPGGFGTLDELFEALTLMQTEKVEPFPVLLCNRTYWEKVIDFNFLVDEGMIEPDDLALFSYVESAEEAFEKIVKHYGLL